jgi:hypothetical protein
VILDGEMYKIQTDPLPTGGQVDRDGSWWGTLRGRWTHFTVPR